LLLDFPRATKFLTYSTVWGVDTISLALVYTSLGLTHQEIYVAKCQQFCFC
jgi:hypothetical protein